MSTLPLPVLNGLHTINLIKKKISSYKVYPKAYFHNALNQTCPIEKLECNASSSDVLVLLEPLNMMEIELRAFCTKLEDMFLRLSFMLSFCYNFSKSCIRISNSSFSLYTFRDSRKSFNYFLWIF